jgi:hypothetical protein
MKRKDVAVKTLWYRSIHFVRGLILGKPKYYAGVDWGTSEDKMVVVVMARHKDDGVTVVEHEINPAKEAIQELNTP